MNPRLLPDTIRSAVCGQADTILEILDRGGLPDGLSLEIEEVVEKAWEIAYRPPERPSAQIIQLVPRNRG
jgi:hypothetical protein